MNLVHFFKIYFQSKFARFLLRAQICEEAECLPSEFNTNQSELAHLIYIQQ